MSFTKELQDKIEKTYMSHKLIGNEVFADNEYVNILEEMQNICFSFINNQSNNPAILQKNWKLIFVGLVEIAKRWKSKNSDLQNDVDTGFWDFIAKTLGIQDGSALPSKLYLQFQNIIYSLGKQELIHTADKTGKWYYATILMHSFSPDKSLYSFFDLCYNVFKKDLDFGYTSNEKYICELAANKMKELFAEFTDVEKAISIGTNAYQIHTGLRQLAKSEILNTEFIYMFNSAFAAINAMYNKDQYKPTNYFQAKLKQWWDYKKDIDIPSPLPSGGRHKPVTKKEIAAKYIFQNGEASVFIPPIRLENPNSRIWVMAYNNEEQVFSEEIHTRVGEFTVTSKQWIKPINELVSDGKDIKLRIEVDENNIVIYNSKEKMHREFILFENEAEITSQFVKATNYFIYTFNESLLTFDNIERQSKNLFNIYPVEGDILKGSNRIIYFANKDILNNSNNEIQLFGALPNTEWNLGDWSAQVFGDEMKFLIPISENLRGLELRVDNNKQLLSNLTHTTIDDYYVFENLPNIISAEPTEVAIYSHIKEKDVLPRQNIIKFQNLRIKFNSSQFYDEEIKKLEIVFMDEKKEITFTNKEDRIIYPLNDGELVVHIPYFKWRINNELWHNEPSDKIFWYKSIIHDNGTLLECNLPTDQVVFSALVDGKIIECIEKNKLNGKVEIGKFIYSPENVDKNSIIVFVRIDVNKPKKIFELATKENFIDSPLKYINGKVFWQPESTFIGKNDRTFKIKLKNDNQDYLVDWLSTENQEISGLHEDVYSYSVIIQEKNPFTKAITEIEIFKGDFIVGNKDKFKFKNKTLKILSISTQFHNNNTNNSPLDFWKTTTPKYFIENIVYFGKNNWDDECYNGILYCLDNYGKKKVLNSMINENKIYETVNPVKFYLTSPNTIEMSFNRDGDDLLFTYNPQTKFVGIDDSKGNMCVNFIKIEENKNV